jgi:chromosome partitioning protein
MTGNTRTIEPLRITVGMLKGGPGRTTAAVHIALRIAQMTGERVLLVDADPKNLSAWNWAEDAGETWPELVTVVDWSTSTGLAKKIRDSGFKHVVIDTGNDERILRQSLRASNILLIPCSPTPNDEKRIKPTMDEALEVLDDMPEDYELHAAVLLSKTRKGTNSRGAIREALNGLGIPLLDAEVPLNERYGQAGNTVPSNLGVFVDVVDELIERTQN